MRKNIKYVGIALAAVVGLSFVLVNFINIYLSNKKKLETMIDGINMYLPQKGFEGYDYFTLERCRLEGNNVIWEFTLDPAYINSTRECALPESVNGFVIVDGSSRDDALDLDSAYTNMLFQQSIRFNLLYQYLIVKDSSNLVSNQFQQELEKRQCSQTWRAFSPISEKHIDFTITYQQQKDIEEYCKLERESALAELITEYIKRQNLILVEATKYDDVKMGMALEGSCIVLRCVFDESYSTNGNNPIENIRMDKEEVENELRADASSLPLFFDYKRICGTMENSYIVRYVDWNSHDSIDFRIY